MDYLKGVITKYGNRGVILDTNLLILLIIGSYDVDRIEKFGRTKDRGYTKQDFIFLVNFLKEFNAIYLTPQVLAELSNLTFNKILENDFPVYLRSVIKSIKDKREHYVPKDILLNANCFKFGFTDSSIFELAKKEKLLVLTDDHPLSGFLSKNGMDCININHIKDWGI